MKYLYQQLLGFWSIIILTIILIGVSFTNINRRTLINQNYNQIRGYLQSVGNIISQPEASWSSSFVNPYSDLTPEERLPSSLNYAESILSDQSINFVLINNDKRVVYPANDLVISNEVLNNSEWEKIENGNVVSKTIKQNFNGKNVQTSYVLSSIYVSNKFYGILIASKPIEDLERSEKLITDNLFKGFIISVLFGGAISFGFASRQVKKINDLKRAVNQIANGNYDIEIEEKNSKDEFDELAVDFNKMAVVLQENEKEIYRQEELRKQFMANTSHEMRTPLTTIKGLLEGLQYNAIPENQKEKAISLMQNETDRLIRLVKQNLDYENIRSHQIALAYSTFNVTETMKDIVTQLEKKAISMNDELVLQNEHSIELYADRDRFIQIMVNIITNAIQFTTDGKIIINLKETESSIEVSVEDSGVGMTEDEQRNIWDRYYKADPSRKNTKYGEAGLGLSIVKELVILHKVSIEVESQKDIGTKCTVVFAKGQ